MMKPIECKKGDKLYCIYLDESCLPDTETMKDMKAAGYRFYQDGKMYKPIKKEQNNTK